MKANIIYMKSIVKNFLNNSNRLCILSALVMLSGFAIPSKSQPLNEKLTSAAWQSFSKGQFNEAIKKAEECIDEFDAAAMRLQRELEKSNLIVPEGEVDEKTKAKIFSNGLLNDVAACWFIKAQALEAQNKTDLAFKAYKQCMKYTYGRVWDPDKKIFWSPADASREKQSVSKTKTTSRSGISLHESLTTSAWNAYNNKDYDEAIEKSNDCIDEFEPAALKLQKQLEEGKVPLPPTGKVDEKTEKEVFSHGLLNDVATCWFIKGRSLERQKKVEEAIAAYKKVMQYSYARTWDVNQELFWSPSEVAEERSNYLKN